MKTPSFFRMAMGFVLGVASHFAVAQDFPNRSIQLLVAFPAGGGSDAIGRGFADVASRYLPHPMVVVNKPGASGTIGFAEGAAAHPDGYKVTMVSPELLITPYLGVGSVTYRDFKPVVRINEDPCTVAVQTESPLRNVEEFIAQAKANPGMMSVANSGPGSINHVCAAALEDKAGIQLNHIMYLGSGPMITGLLGGHVEAAVISPAEVDTFVKAGKFRLLAVMSEHRAVGFEDVPTFRERGIDLVLSTWRGLVVPKSTPDTIVAKLEEIVAKVDADPAYQSILERQNLGRILEDSRQFGSFLAQGDVQYARIVPTLNMSK